MLDIGSSPGGWSQVASEIIKEGKIISIDIKDMNKLDKVTFIKCDFLENEAKTKILDESGGKLDVVISDMAANTTGNKNLDCIRTNLLCAEVINFSFNMLKNKGILVAKIFMGDTGSLALAKKNFKKVDFFKPESSRNESKETYIHCSLLNTL